MEQHEMEKEMEYKEGGMTAEDMSRFIKKEDKKEWMLPASIVFAAIVIAAAFIYASGSKSPAPAVDQEQNVNAPQIIQSDVVLGNADAKVTIIEYGDFQCPYCSLFYKQFEPIIKKELIETGMAKYVFRPFPFLGDESDAATIAVECAKDQGKFWDMHNAIYDAEYKEFEQVMKKKLESSENNGNLNTVFFARIAQASGMDVGAFSNCISSGPYMGSPAAFRDGAKEIGVRGTPSIFVNGEPLNMELFGTPEKIVSYVKGLSR